MNPRYIVTALLLSSSLCFSMHETRSQRSPNRIESNNEYLAIALENARRLRDATLSPNPAAKNASDAYSNVPTKNCPLPEVALSQEQVENILGNIADGAESFLKKRKLNMDPQSDRN